MTTVERHFVAEKDGLYTARPEERLALAYYANSIGHLVEEAKLAGTASVLKQR